MGAIYGRFDLSDQPIVTSGIDRIEEILKVWGPDHFDHLLQGSVALAQATLYVAPHARYEQIARTKDGYFVVADAIIDNRGELATELALHRDTLDSLSDTALIALAWEKWGKGCVDHLIGDFAFSVVNLAHRSVFLARDHIGARPLYWAKRGETLLWCTDADLLVQQPEWQWPLSLDAIVSFQADDGSPLPATFFEHLQRLEPGHTAAFESHQTMISRWWNPSTRPSITLSSPADYAATCRALVDRAVLDRCATSLPIGAHLSGGIDSTGVAVIAARHLDAETRQLCGGYAWSPDVSDAFPDMGAKDERRRIMAVGTKENIPVRFGTSNGDNIFAFFKRPLETEGIADLADEMPILRSAARDRARIVLSGWGGDEGFSSHGIGYLAHLLMRGKFAKAKKFMHRRTRTLKNLSHLSQIIWWGAVHLMLPNWLQRRFNQYQDPNHNHVFMPLDTIKAHKKQISRRQHSIVFCPHPNENIKRYLFHGHIAMRMETWAAWSAPFGLQYRYPLTDRRLLEFLMSIPPEALYPDELPRGLALAALADVLPSDVTKYDAANELLRAQARFDCWQIAAEQTASGLLNDNCPWLDMPALRTAALSPIDQSIGANVMRFAELMSALRLWFMWKRRN